MNHRIKFLVFIALLSLATSPAYAKRFANQFVEFELPLNWDCALEGAEWVCQSLDAGKKRDAIIVLAAKLKGDQDDLIKYQEYLSKARNFNGPTGKSVTSQPKYTRISDLNSHKWVDSLHLESEIPGFYTRYLATVEKDIGVLVTYSINQKKYQEYLPQFDNMVKSVKVFRKAGGGINQNSNTPLASLSGNIASTHLFPEAVTPPVATEVKKPAPPKEDNDLLIYGIAAAAVLGFIIIKKRRG